MSQIAQRRASAKRGGDEEYQQRRAQLVSAAARVFKAKGFGAASVNDIAKEARMDRASLYYYAAGKEELFQEVIYEVVLSNVVMAETIREDRSPPPEKVRTFVTSLVRSYERHYPYLFVFIQEDMAQIAEPQSGWAREMRRLAKRFDEAVIGIVQAGIDDGSFKRVGDNARLAAFGIIGMCNWSHRWFRPGAGEGADKVGAVFADMVLDGL